MQRKLPTLDFLKGFEAAARHLSFTQAAAELFVTQSAVSRQVQALEEQLGVALFERRHKEIALTEAGQTLYGTASLVLHQLREAVERLDGGERTEALIVTCTIAFASLWLIPRLASFRREQPNIEVHIAADNSLVDLERRRMDVAIRFCPPKLAPDHAEKLFGEEIFPVCAPGLLRDRSRPLRTPCDLKHHTLLYLEEPGGLQPWVNWSTWLEPLREAHAKPGLRFNHYDQMIQAAVDGQGIALGCSPLVRDLIEQGKLVAPFSRRKVSPRAYFVFASRETAARPPVEEFVGWLKREAKRDEQRGASAPQAESTTAQVATL